MLLLESPLHDDVRTSDTGTRWNTLYTQVVVTRGHDGVGGREIRQRYPHNNGKVLRMVRVVRAGYGMKADTQRTDDDGGDSVMGGEMSRFVVGALNVL